MAGAPLGGRGPYAAAAALGGAAYWGTARLVPVVAAATLKRGMWGKDINKRGTPAGQAQVPEALGLAVGLVFLVTVIIFQHVHLYTVRQDELARAEAGVPGTLSWLEGLMRPLRQEEPKRVGYSADTLELLLQYDVALACIVFMLFLGFADDVLDIPWRIKLALPTFAALPLLSAYPGGTCVLIPRFLQGILRAKLLELGALYHVYMLLFVVFATNSINILAGLNGLEAGQTLVVACSCLVFNLQQVARRAWAKQQHLGEPLPLDFQDDHLFSAALMVALIGTTLGLLRHNWFPSKVFVGDTFTYFAGMVLAVCGILCHFSETLLIFMLPQVLNFVYSLPQLFKIVPCPRHRLPRFDPKTGMLHPSPRPDGGPNLNLVNLFLRLFGPASEEALCLRLLAFQALCCAAGFAVHALLEGHYK